MSWLLSLIYPSDPVIAKTDIVIEDGSLFLEEQAKEVLLYRADVRMLLPIRRHLGGFPVYSAEKVDEDSERILDWMLEQGFKDAVVTTEIQEFQGDFPFRLPRVMTGVEVQYQVFRGIDWNIQEVLIEGIDAAPFLVPKGPMPWSQSVADNLVVDIQHHLSQNGFLHPKISVGSTMVMDNAIRLSIDVEPGELYYFGHLQLINSLDDQEIQLVGCSREQWEAEVFDVDKLERLRFQLQELKTIDSVSYQLLERPNSQIVDVEVQVLYKDHWSNEPILSISSEATTFASDVGFQWEKHLQPFARPLSFEGIHQVGGRWFPQFSNQDFGYYGIATTHGLEGRMSLHSTSGLSVLAGVFGNMDTQIGYQSTQQRLYSGVRWQISPEDFMTVQYSWNQWVYESMFNQDAMYQQWFAGFEGLDDIVQQPQIEWNWIHFEENRQLLQVHTVPLGWSNQSRFSRFSMNLEQRVLLGRWMWRARLSAGSTIWYDEPTPALNNRFFLGGFQSLRGWSYRRVRVPNSTAGNFDLMEGGDKMLFASLEGRFQILPLYQMVYFIDVGRIWPHWSSAIHLQDWLPSVGVGLMVPTLVGDVIFLPTYQLNANPQLEFAPSRWGFHVAFAPKMRPY